MAKMPAFQFYPADWRKSPDVQAMSFFDRGVWFEILCLMHESDERGRLMLAGRPMNDESLMRILGISYTKLKNSLNTILSLGVAYRDDDGALCNRRMMRDERLRAVRAATTGLVCLKLRSRQFIGIELNPKYIEIAERRISKL